MLLFIANWKTHEAVARSSNAHNRFSKALTKLKAALSSMGSSFSRQRSTAETSDSDLSVRSLQYKILLEANSQKTFRRKLKKKSIGDTLTPYIHSKIKKLITT
jgi:hypothetical protein